MFESVHGVFPFHLSRSVVEANPVLYCFSIGPYHNDKDAEGNVLIDRVQGEYVHHRPYVHRIIERTGPQS